MTLSLEAWLMLASIVALLTVYASRRCDPELADTLMVLGLLLQVLVTVLLLLR